MSEIDYRAAYERQKKARHAADKLLEDKSRELYEASQTLSAAYNRLKKQKEQLLHQEKLASIGQLSAGVAHEINNPAAYIKSNINSLNAVRCALATCFSQLADLREKPVINYEDITHIVEKNDIEFILTDMQEVIEDSLFGLEKITGIVKSLKDFSRPDTDGDRCFSVNECIQNTLKLVSSEIKYKAELITHYGDVPEIMGSSGEFSQVILNLVVNASHAISETGKININTALENNSIKITVSDTGKGMDPKLALKIFDPFFTTKEVGKGTGLGLSISHGIVKNLGGYIHVDSIEGKGTTFTITLPVNT
ncbi:sensor histidine kinase [Saccharophagus degradans]|uniref:histidine kinase n=1 Tax=Saccharophagus degradans (strain 2-40 / ATCC 43961 / DSM 17024) TaxID=203122 RepID=Q21E21_SACD2|nr:ATP-binding protein [Saccharophagus degradans]ABD83058.1 ATP-binding region, ATPase-like protein [Saccharophagus degradans 2-40]